MSILHWSEPRLCVNRVTGQASIVCRYNTCLNVEYIMSTTYRYNIV